MSGEFEAKMDILYGRMALEVINVLEPFMAFAKTFNVFTTQNLCAL